MKVTSYISLFFISILLLQCSKEPSFESLVPYQKEENSYWGYVNFEGKVIISPRFKDLPGLFYEGYAIIETSDGSVDYINKSGEEYERNYIEATDFQEGIAFAIKEDEYPCVLNPKLEEVKALEKVDEIYIPSEGMICFKNTRGKWGFMNTDFNVVIEPVYDDAYSFSDGLAWIKKIEIDTTNEIKTEKVLLGFIDKEGNEVIKPTNNLSIVLSFSEGMAAYSDGYEWGWGFIDKSGKKVIRAKTEWQHVTDFNEGVASVEVNGFWGLINKKGEMILNCKYNNPLYFFNGLAAVEKDDKIGFINQKGKWIIEPEYDNILLAFSHPRAIVEKDNYFIFINKSGNPTSNSEFYNIDFSTEKNISVKSDFFDIEPILDTLFPDIKSGSINGMTASTPLSDIMKINQLNNNNLPEDSWDKYLDLDNIYIGDEIEISTTLYFNKNVSVPIKQYTSYYSWWYYEEIVGYKPNIQAQLNSVSYEIELSGRKEGKAVKLAKGLKRLFEQYNYSLNEDSSSDEKYILNGPDSVIEVTINFKENNINVSIDL